MRDEETKTQIAYDMNGFLSYDDERAICDKTEYVINESLHGFIIWEIRLGCLFHLPSFGSYISSNKALSFVSVAEM